MIYRVSILIFLLYALGFAQLSPGDLHLSHADYEGIANCTVCHQTGQKLSSEKCLTCHVLLKKRIESNSGFHAGNEKQECEACHIEHQGRNSQLIYWTKGIENFNHDETGYPLAGAHGKVKCRECHKTGNIQNSQLLLDHKKDPAKTFLGLGTNCLSCHIDVHKNTLDKNCLSCHEMQGWKPADLFDHSKVAFALTGKHIDVPCQKCHPITEESNTSDIVSFQKYTGLPHAACSDCHTDPHDKRLGESCVSCHSTVGWSQAGAKNFDHSKTSYALKGKHKFVNCKLCHKPGLPLSIKEFQTCTDCHPDYHFGQFKTRNQKGACEECHSVDGFSPAQFTTEQHGQGRFPLKGAHRAIPCEACHIRQLNGNQLTGAKYRDINTSCSACHSNPHGTSVEKYDSVALTSERLDGCLLCHNEDSWSSIVFNHAQTTFQLDGRHATTACKNCHFPKAEQKQLFSKLSGNCVTCHEDIHRGQFIDDTANITRCERCHTPQDWYAERFSHDEHSTFKLEGAHKFVACNTCHKKSRDEYGAYIRYKLSDTSCKSCHGSTQLKL